MIPLSDEFISYLLAQIGLPYLWGGQHTKLTKENYKSVIHKKEAGRGSYSDGLTYEQAVIDFCEKKFKKTDTLYAYDCSGLGMYWLYNVKKLYKSDMTADSMMRKCELTSGKPKKGYWVFRLNASKSAATHIGYMVDDTYLVEAKGRRYGVTKTKFVAKNWDKWGIPLIFKSQIVKQDDKQEGFVFSRVLKYGSKGDDVKQLKQLLYEAGYKSLTVTNANYLSKTVSVVKKYQKDHGITADGKAGKETITSLGGNYI